MCVAPLILATGGYLALPRWPLQGKEKRIYLCHFFPPFLSLETSSWPSTLSRRRDSASRRLHLIRVIPSTPLLARHTDTMNEKEIVRSGSGSDSHSDPSFIATVKDISSPPDPVLAVREQIAAMSAEEYALAEKKLLRKLDLRLIPWMTWVPSLPDGADNSVYCTSCPSSTESTSGRPS